MSFRRKVANNGRDGGDGDLIRNLQLIPFLLHKENHSVITMICDYKNINIPYCVVEAGMNGTIEGMKENPLMSFLTNIGICIVEPEVIDGIEKGVPIGLLDIVEKEW